MRVFVAGATGVIGKQLLPQLLEAGHQVTGMTRSPQRKAGLETVGVEPVVCDALSAEALRDAVRKARPDVVVHQLTSLPKAIDPRKIAEQLAANDNLRTRGTQNLIRAAVLAGVGRIVAQSIAFAYEPVGGPVKTEEDPLWLDAPQPYRRSVRAIAELEREVTGTKEIEGIALRYGYFYGPGSALASDGSLAAMVRKRSFPIVGSGSGMYSFIHLDDAAAATVAALKDLRPGVYNVVDDEPSPLREWLPEYAKALQAPEPRRVPTFLARLMAGWYGVYLTTRQRGASNARIRRAGWAPHYTTWRSGLHEALTAGSPQSRRAR